MRYVRLGQTDLKVSAVAFGTWAFGGDWGAADLHDSNAAIGRALGINRRRPPPVADDLRRIELIVADAVPVWGPHPEGM